MLLSINEKAFIWCEIHKRCKNVKERLQLKIWENFITGISWQEGRIYDCSPLANISKFEFSRDVFFNLRARFHNLMTLQIIISSAANHDCQKFKSPMLRAGGRQP